MALEYERDWFEWLFEVWADTSYEPLEIWDETQILLDLNPPKRHIAPGTTGLTLSANKSHLYPRCEATLMPGSKPSAQYRGHWRGLKVWDIDLQLLEGSMFPYSGNMSPAIPGGVTFITSATDSSGQGPALPNQAPTITLGAASGSIAQNANTSSPINLTTVTINDDGQGTNTLAISGAGTTILEIVGGQLRIKAGASLSVGVITATITVDDATVGGTPDDSETFTLTVTASNAAPTLTLGATSGTVAEDADTASPINLTTVTVNDDGQGSNTLSISGAGTEILEIAGGQLRIKAAATLAASDITATITVDDPLVGGNPDDSETFTLSITAAASEETEMRTTNKGLFSTPPNQTLYPVGTVVHYVQDLTITAPTSSLTDEHLVYASDEAGGTPFWKFIDGRTHSYDLPSAMSSPLGPRHVWVRYQTGAAPTIITPRANVSGMGGGYFYTWT
jgi:hypothetical protein